MAMLESVVSMGKYAIAPPLIVTMLPAGTVSGVLVPVAPALSTRI
jgi:hypothetical protein